MREGLELMSDEDSITRVRAMSFLGYALVPLAVDDEPLKWTGPAGGHGPTVGRRTTHSWPRLPRMPGPSGPHNRRSDITMYRSKRSSWRNAWTPRSGLIVAAYLLGGARCRLGRLDDAPCRAGRTIMYDATMASATERFDEHESLLPGSDAARRTARRVHGVDLLYPTDAEGDLDRRFRPGNRAGGFHGRRPDAGVVPQRGVGGRLCRRSRYGSVCVRHVGGTRPSPASRVHGLLRSTVAGRHRRDTRRPDPSSHPGQPTRGLLRGAHRRRQLLFRRSRSCSGATALHAWPSGRGHRPAENQPTSCTRVWA